MLLIKDTRKNKKSFTVLGARSLVNSFFDCFFFQNTWDAHNRYSTNTVHFIDIDIFINSFYCNGHLRIYYAFFFEVQLLEKRENFRK